jgi:hypothetical protein
MAANRSSIHRVLSCSMIIARDLAGATTRRVSPERSLGGTTVRTCADMAAA